MKILLLSFFIFFSFSCSAQDVLIEKDTLGGAVRFFEKDKLIFTKTFKNGLEDGLSVRIDSTSGKVKYIYDSYKQKPRGLLINFYPNGSIKSIREKDLTGEGQFIEFYDNGTIKELSYRVKGRTNGWVYKYDSSGIITSKEFFKDGEKLKTVKDN